MPLLDPVPIMEATLRGLAGHEDGARVAGALLDRIETAAADLGAAAGAPIRLLNFCGSHQDTLNSNGLDQRLLERGVDMRPGPGCPVCITPTRAIRAAIEHAVAPGRGLITYGDMGRVPVPTNTPDEPGSLAAAAARGGTVVLVGAPIEAARNAATHPETEWVFLAPGFETTMAPTAALLLSGPPANLSVLSALRWTLPAAELCVAAHPDVAGIVLPGHVCTIMGWEAWSVLGGTHGLRMVVSGFEGLDLLLAIHRMLTEARPGEVLPGYGRLVREQGNPRARAAIDEAFVRTEGDWRGLPSLPASAAEIAPSLAAWDASVKHPLDLEIAGPDHARGCRCAEVILGHLRPSRCPLFGTVCTPDAAVGPCMVGREGACHVEYLHHGTTRRAGAAQRPEVVG